MSSIPRGEHPRPSFVKENWLNLNGPWQFATDPGDSGFDQGWVNKEFDRTIIVPFCPESALSQIGNTDFMTAVWYRRTVTLPEKWKQQRILLHFQAVDFDSTVWVNGKEVYRHRGGFTPFTCDLGILESEEITIVLRARDQKFSKPMGKQSARFAPYSSKYARTTGIWQTVWLEAVPDVYMKRPRITPLRTSKSFLLEIPVSSSRKGLNISAELLCDGKSVAQSDFAVGYDLTPMLTLSVPPEFYREWSIEDPFLYDIRLSLKDCDGNILETALCYAGMRSFAIDGNKFLINDRQVFQRLVLDQGYYPDGIMTAPSDEALQNDIRLSQAAGFNGARLHQKVFEERFLYHADRMGYIVWGEFGDWGVEFSEFGFADRGICQPAATMITQWLEALERDYSHPALCGWCAINEIGHHTWNFPSTDQICTIDDVVRGTFLAAKASDRTRPVLDASGYSHRVVESDVFDTHNYEQDPEKFKKAHEDLHSNNGIPRNLPYRGQPFFNSEFGGIRWNPAKANDPGSWGYGQAPKSLEEFYSRFEGLVTALQENPDMFGYCYTQLTDIFTEENGIYTFDRSVKFDVEKIRKIQQRAAAYETENQKN